MDSGFRRNDGYARVYLVRMGLVGFGAVGGVGGGVGVSGGELGAALLAH